MVKAKQEISSLLKSVFVAIGFKGEPSLSHPADPSHGDYSSNVALVAAKDLKQNPMELAAKIKDQLEASSQKPEAIEKIEIAKPGFINFWLSKQYLLSQLGKMLKQGEIYGSSNSLKDQKIMLEFADPNPFKEFHIGHLRNIALGETLARLWEMEGAVVWRVNYQGDVGLHVAKALWGMMELKEQMPDEHVPLSEKVAFLGRAYALGSRMYEEDNEEKEEIQALNVKIYKKDSSILPLWKLGRKWSLDQFESIYKRVGTIYKRYYFESEVAQAGRDIVLSHLSDGTFERHEEAVVFRGKHTRVFVTKEDYATYEAKDLALSGLKYQDFPYDSSVIITAHEQAPYFQVVLEAMNRVAPKLAKKTRHFSFGFVSLKEGKMSSRTGNVITGEWLLDEAKIKIQKEFTEMDEETAEKVAVSAVKYSLLKFSPPADIKFSFEDSISLEGNSGPYLQYTFARIKSVLAKSATEREDREFLYDKMDIEAEEEQLLRTLHRFGQIVEEAAVKFAPNLLCNYLFDLAQTFNLFYQKHKIIGSGSEHFRLSLTNGVGVVLGRGLALLGIAAPKRM